MELIYLFAILAVLGITGIIYAAVEFHRQNRRPAKIFRKSGKPGVNLCINYVPAAGDAFEISLSLQE